MNRLLIFISLVVPSFVLYACGTSKKADLRGGTEEFYYAEGLRGYHENNMGYAEDCLKRVLAINPKHDAALYYMANIKYTGGHQDEALKYMQAAARADSSNYWYPLQIAQLYIADQQMGQAIKVYEDLIARYPQKSDLYYDLANLYMNDKDTGKALELLDEIEKTGGVSEATEFYRFNILMMQGKRDEAQRQMEQLSENYASPRFLTILGDMYAESGKDTLALACYDRAIALEPNYIPAVFGQGEMYRIRQQYDIFFEKMNVVMDNADVITSIKTDYMERLLQNRAFVGTFLLQVDTLFTKLYMRHSSDTSVVYPYAGFLIQASQENRAVEVLKKNVQRDPRDQVAWIQYLSVNYYLQHWDSLYSIAKEALTLFPRQPEIMSMQGLAAWQTGDIPEAIAIFESVLSIAKKDRAILTQTYSILGDLYHAAGDVKKSFDAYEKTLKLDPNQMGALNNYAYFLALEKKDLKKAYEMSKKTIDAEPQNATYLDTFGWILYLLDRPQEAKAIFRQVFMYGKEQSAEVLDHYAEVLYALREYDMAFLYWEQAKAKEKNPVLEKKIEERKAQMKK